MGITTMKTEESKCPLIEEKGPSAMELQHHHHEIEIDLEFWPVEHPVEPSEEDRPVKCPMPDSSSVINGGEMQEGRFSESFRKRAEQAAAVNREGKSASDMQPSVRVVRKRHHTLTHGDHMKPALSTPQRPPLPTQSITIFEMLQQPDKFNS